MVSAAWTQSPSLTLREFFLGYPRNILSVGLSLVAAVTKVGVAPAEPLGHRTAESALERDIFLPMALAFCSVDGTAPGAHQLLRLEFLVLRSHGFGTAAFPPEVRLVALVALEICVYGHRILPLVLVVGRFWIGKFLVGIITLVLESF